MSNKALRVIGIILFLFFAVCVFLGAAMGESDIVFNKASQICMECIGIG